MVSKNSIVPKGNFLIMNTEWALTQGGVKMLCSQGHTVYIQKNAGIGSGIKDEDFKQAGAKIVLRCR